MLMNDQSQSDLQRAVWELQQREQITTTLINYCVNVDRNDLAHNRAPRPVEALLEDVTRAFGPHALPQAWPTREGGRWIRTIREEYALVDGIDPVAGRLSWLLPVSRARDATPLASDPSARTHP
jgi:hypothetical protein